MDLLFAPKVSQDEIAYLAVLIEDHHSSFSQHYPSCNIIPKLITCYTTLHGLVGNACMVNHYVM